MSFIPDSPYNTFTIEVTDVEQRPFNNIHEIFYDQLRSAHLPVEVLYSGGLDSECVLVSCLAQNIPVVAVTLRILVNNCPVNLVDLYYAEKFCRERNIKHVVVDLELTRFIDNGDHIPYIENYNIDNLGAITIQWLIQQCHSFPVIGGDYTWPQVNSQQLRYSPKSYSHNSYDLFMQEQGIPGIGNFIGYSSESNSFFVKEHINVFNKELTVDNIKVKMLENLGFGKLEPRIKSNGWELLRGIKDQVNLSRLTNDFNDRCNPTISTIKWNQTLASMIGGEPGENSDRNLKKLVDTSTQISYN